MHRCTLNPSLVSFSLHPLLSFSEVPENAELRIPFAPTYFIDPDEENVTLVPLTIQDPLTETCTVDIEAPAALTPLSDCEYVLPAAAFARNVSLRIHLRYQQPATTTSVNITLPTPYYKSPPPCTESPLPPLSLQVPAGNTADVIPAVVALAIILLWSSAKMLRAVAGVEERLQRKRKEE